LWNKNQRIRSSFNQDFVFLSLQTIKTPSNHLKMQFCCSNQLHIIYLLLINHLIECTQSINQVLCQFFIFLLFFLNLIMKHWNQIIFSTYFSYIISYICLYYQSIDIQLDQSIVLWFYQSSTTKIDTNHLKVEFYYYNQLHLFQTYYTIVCFIQFNWSIDLETFNSQIQFNLLIKSFQVIYMCKILLIDIYLDIWAIQSLMERLQMPSSVCLSCFQILINFKLTI